jgi:hypothetical protein
MQTKGALFCRPCRGFSYYCAQFLGLHAALRRFTPGYRSFGASGAQCRGTNSSGASSAKCLGADSNSVFGDGAFAAAGAGEMAFAAGLRYYLNLGADSLFQCRDV